MRSIFLATAAALLFVLAFSAPSPGPDHLEVIFELDRPYDSLLPTPVKKPFIAADSAPSVSITALLYGPTASVLPGFISFGVQSAATTTSSVFATATPAFHIAISGAAASCSFVTADGITYQVISRKYSGSKEIPYGPVTFRSVTCVALKNF